MTDIDGGFDDLLRRSDAPASPVREGLPPSYRMRASAHYVEQLDSESASSPVRYIHADAIEAHGDSPAPGEAFVESIRRHGVLQPLLVQRRSGRYHLIAGRKRLSAARALGIGEVPCLVHRVGDREAVLLAEAANVPSIDSPAGAAPTLLPLGETGEAAAALAQCVAALTSSANLLSSDGTLRGGVALDLVKAESARALDLLLAMRIFADDAPIARRRVPARTIVDRALQRTAAERRLRGLEVTVPDEEGSGPWITVDEDLMSTALAALIIATGALLAQHGARAIRLTTSIGPDGWLAFRVLQEAVVFTDRRLACMFDAGGFSGPDAAPLSVLLPAARRIVERHGGRALASATPGGSELALVVPAATWNQ